MSYELALVAFQLNFELADTSVAPLRGDGLEGLPGVVQPIVTVKELDQDETTEVWLAHLACTFT